MAKSLNKTKEFRISGLYDWEDKVGVFNGTLTIKENASFYYCSWRLIDENGNALVEKSIPIYFQQIPDEQDKIKYTQHYAIEGIKNQRIGKKKLVVELSIDDTDN